MSLNSADNSTADLTAVLSNLHYMKENGGKKFHIEPCLDSVSLHIASLESIVQ